VTDGIGLDDVEINYNMAPYAPLPPTPKSSPSNSLKKIPGDSNDSSTANLSEIPKTEVEVFEFREVEASPMKPSAEAESQTQQRPKDTHKSPVKPSPAPRPLTPPIPPPMPIMDSKPTYAPTTAPSTTPNYNLTPQTTKNYSPTKATFSPSNYPPPERTNYPQVNYPPTAPPPPNFNGNALVHPSAPLPPQHYNNISSSTNVQQSSNLTKTIDRRERKERKERCGTTTGGEKRERKDRGVGTTDQAGYGGVGAERAVERERGGGGERRHHSRGSGEPRGGGMAAAHEDRPRERKDKAVGGKDRGGKGVKDRREVMEQGDELTIKLLQEIERRQERAVAVAVAAHAAAASREAASREVDDGPEKELDFPSDQESMCDCPAHIHDRESPLLLAQVRMCDQASNQGDLVCAYCK